MKELGYAGVIYNVALQAAVLGMQAALASFAARAMGGCDAAGGGLSERQRLVHKDEFDALERKYAEKH